MGLAGGTSSPSRRSTTALSAVPAPCATHTPEQAWISGSNAVTSPLAERLTTMRPSAARSCRIGSRLASTTIGPLPSNASRHACTCSTVHGPVFGSRCPSLSFPNLFLCTNPVDNAPACGAIRSRGGSRRFLGGAGVRCRDWPLSPVCRMPPPLLDALRLLHSPVAVGGS